jgi:uncharacterized membrane protein YbhN (UPF0104 family)
VALTAWAFRGGNDLDRRVTEYLAEDLPSWVSGIFTIGYVMGGIYTTGLVLAILIFGTGRRSVARDMIVASILAAAGLILLARWTGPEWPDVIPELLEREGAPSFPLTRLTASIAALRVAEPYLTVPMRNVGKRLALVMTLSGLVLSYGTITSVVGAVALGAAAAAAVHLVFGSGIGIPSKPRIISSLEALGLNVADVEYVEDQPMGATLVSTELADGTPLLVKYYGRDSSSAALTTRLWRKTWYRNSHRAISATGLQLVEHEGLLLLDAARSGVGVPDLVAWGRSADGDGILATQSPPGTHLNQIDSDDLSEAQLDQIWEALAVLHAANMAQGAIDGSKILISKGSVSIEDLADGSISPSIDRRRRDMAQLLVTTALVVGADRAIAASRRSLGDAELAEVVPLMQTNALPSALQAAAKAQKLKLKDLRNQVAETNAVKPAELVQIQRVSWKSLGMAAAMLLAAYALIAALSDIGFDVIVEELSSAIIGWVILAFIFAQLTNAGEWVSLTGVVDREVPFGPTIMFRYALSFISLAVPSDAASIGMNIRYMQKLGVSTAAAVAQGPLLTVFSKGFDILLLLISMRIIGQTIDLDDLDAGPILRLVVLVVVLAGIGVVITLVVPKLRRMVLPPLKEGFGAIRSSITDPQRLLRVAGGTLTQKILFALTLSASVAAYGETLSFGEAIFVNSAVSLFIGLVPVPGGIGVAEAGLAAGLTLVGISEEAAFAAAITHRIVTAYIPPIFGAYTTRWLGDRDYL